MYQFWLPILSLLALGFPFLLVERRANSFYRLRLGAAILLYWGVVVLVWVLAFNEPMRALRRPFVPRPHYVWSLEVRP